MCTNGAKANLRIPLSSIKARLEKICIKCKRINATLLDNFFFFGKIFLFHKMFICYVMELYGLASLVAQMVKNLPTVLETQVRSLGQKDPLEKGMATHSSIRAWRILWKEEPDGLQSRGSQRVRHN